MALLQAVLDHGPVVLHLTVLQLDVRRMVLQVAVPLVLVPRIVNLRLSPEVGVCVTLSVALQTT